MQSNAIQKDLGMLLGETISTWGLAGFVLLHLVGFCPMSSEALRSLFPETLLALRDKLSDPNSTPLPTGPGIKYVTRTGTSRAVPCPDLVDPCRAKYFRAVP